MVQVLIEEVYPHLGCPVEHSLSDEIAGFLMTGVAEVLNYPLEVTELI
jgi:hypothetical protein